MPNLKESEINIFLQIALNQCFPTIPSLRSTYKNINYKLKFWIKITLLTLNSIS